MQPPVSTAAHPLPLTGVVVTFNEAPRIARCVRSLLMVCAEVLVIDSHSTDGTREAAAAAGARVIERDWPGFAAQKNFAIASAAQPWVLLLDGDEWLTPELAEEIQSEFRRPGGPAFDAYAIPRRNLFLGRELRHGLLGNERIIRLFRNDLRYRDMRVHESFELGNRQVSRLRAGFLHDHEMTLPQYAAKLARYAELSAEEKRRQGKRAHWWDTTLRPAFHFFKNYVLRGGFLDGRPGFILEWMNAGYVRRKYLALGRSGIKNQESGIR